MYRNKIKYSLLFLPASGGHAGQVAAIQETAGQLSDVRRLNELHYDWMAGQYRDWGEHTEAVAMRWVDWKTTEGQLVKRGLVRAVGKPDPSPQLVPHFG